MRKKITNEDFVAKAKEVHGDWYDYSKVEYQNNHTKVCIICPKHGEFWQTPGKHLSGRGCKKCGHLQNIKKQSSTNEKFIKKACEIHGHKYDYSKVEYKNNRTKVCIICPEHGEFWQIPNSHLSGCGCPKCSGKYKMDTNYFITKAKEIHGDKYDYSKVEYKNIRTKVCIICPEHGEFWQTPEAHLNGHGCKKCAGQYSPSREEFISKAIEIHGNKYDYSKVNYTNCDTKVCIICPEHGEFWQTPYTHLKGCGCMKCQQQVYDIETFVNKGKDKFGDKFDYSKTVYVNSKTPLTITCPIHGDFEIIPSQHFILQKGCPKCVRENKRLTKEEFINKVQVLHGGKYDYSLVEDFHGVTDKVTIICPEHGAFKQQISLHLNGTGCPNCHGLRREYKFNLLEEFIDEYRLRDFLMTNDENLIYVILRNIEKIDPKFNTIINDIDRVLRSDSTNPIEDLEDKYRAQDETVTTDFGVEEVTSVNIDDIDLDDDDAIEAFISHTTTTAEKTEPTIDELTRARENEINLINSIEHMLTPEDRQFIKDKFLNDKRRNWMLERDKK